EAWCLELAVETADRPAGDYVPAEYERRGGGRRAVECVLRGRCTCVEGQPNEGPLLEPHGPVRKLGAHARPCERAQRRCGPKCPAADAERGVAPGFEVQAPPGGLVFATRGDERLRAGTGGRRVHPRRDRERATAADWRRRLHEPVRAER